MAELIEPAGFIGVGCGLDLKSREAVRPYFRSFAPHAASPAQSASGFGRI